MTWTFQQLMENTGKSPCGCQNLISSQGKSSFTGISQDNLQQILGILFKVRLLECDVPESDLQKDTEITLYTLFKK
jgi:hypothetical protein